VCDLLGLATPAEMEGFLKAHSVSAAAAPDDEKRERQELARAAAQDIREMSKGVTLGGLKIKDLKVTNTGAVVPSLWRLETGNGLQIAIGCKRIDAAFKDRALLDLARLAITIDLETDAQAWTTTLQLADRFQLTLYDAAYLELAQRRALPLATLDKALRSAADALGLTLLGV